MQHAEGAVEKYDFVDKGARQAAKHTSPATSFGKGSYRGKDMASPRPVLQGNEVLTASDAMVLEGSPKQMTQNRSRTFRERRLSKDMIVDDTVADEIADQLKATQSPGASHSANSSTTSRRIRESKELDSVAATRQVSLEQLVQLEAEEEEAGNRDSMRALEEVIDIAAPVSPTPPGLHASASQGLETPGRIRRTKPSEQPKTAEKSAALHGSQVITIGMEMGTEENSGLSFDASIVGTYSCHGQEPGKEGCAVAKINQDCACMGHPFAGLKGTAIFSVYDGHGKYGHEVSQEAMHTIFHMLEESADELYDEPAGTLADAFEACNMHLRLMACEPEIEVNSLESGTCAAVAYLHHRELFVASVGDCRCVIGAIDEAGAFSSLQLSTDHKVDLPAEQERIESKGGWVRASRIDPEDGEFVPARMYEVEGKQWLGPGLCISRALGDLNALRVGLVPTPEISKHTLRPEDRFLILASDGVWEFMENDEVVQTVASCHEKGLPALDACRYLIAKAAVCWRKFEGNYRDDITAIVVYLDETLNILADEDPDQPTQPTA
jgi:serine/threonine protein phosphatase PrpC